MNLVCFNDKYGLFSDDKLTYLLEIPSFGNRGSLEMITKIGYLQYATGIAALVCQSKIRIYDFIFKKDVYDFQSYSKVQKVSLLKNLLVIISSQRILIHDLKTKTNQCYIPILNGQIAFISRDYYNLKIAYQTQTHLLANRQIWLNRVSRLQGVQYQLGAYSLDAQLIALVYKNILSLYRQNELIKIYSCDYDIVELVSLKNWFFVKLENGSIFGYNQNNQANFLQYQQIELQFWDKQYQSVIFGDSSFLYQMKKDIVKKYRLDYVHPVVRGGKNTIQLQSTQNKQSTIFLQNVSNGP